MPVDPGGTSPMIPLGPSPVGAPCLYPPNGVGFCGPFLHPTPVTTTSRIAAVRLRNFVHFMTLCVLWRALLIVPRPVASCSPALGAHPQNVWWARQVKLIPCHHQVPCSK